MTRMPRTNQKRGIVFRTQHIANLEAKAHAEKKARQQSERELRVLRKLRFNLDDQTPSVRTSLKLINHTSPL